MEKNKIRNLTQLRKETSRVRKAIKEKEELFTGDVVELVESITPLRIIKGIAGKVIAGAPVIHMAYSIFRSIFWRKR